MNEVVHRQQDDRKLLVLYTVSRMKLGRSHSHSENMPKKDWPPEDGDITHLIERLDALEERENVRFEALYALFFTGSDGCPWLRVCGEIHARDGFEIAHELKVAVTAYDPKGRILNTGMESVTGPEKFYGFEAFVIQLNTIGPIAKVRLYPQRV